MMRGWMIRAAVFRVMNSADLGHVFYGFYR